MRITVRRNCHFGVSGVVEMPEEDTGSLSSALVGVDGRVATLAVDVDHDMDAEDGAAVVLVIIVVERDEAGFMVDVESDTSGAGGGGKVVDDNKDAAGDCDCVVSAY